MMKRVWTVLVLLAMLLALAACGGEPADAGTPTDNAAVTDDAAEPTPDETAEPTPEPTPEPPAVIDTIELDFVKLTLTEVGSGEKLVAGNVSQSPGDESVVYFWLKGTLMNLNGQAYEIWGDMQCPVQLIFDDTYYYDGGLERVGGIEMAPLVENNIYLTATVPPALLDTYQQVEVRFGFNDDFAEPEYYDTPVDEFTYIYSYTFDRDGNLIAGGSGTETVAAGTVEGEAAGETAGDDTIAIALGDMIETESYEFTLSNIEFSYEVLPPDTSGYYNYYSPEAGNVYIHVDADLKNQMKRDIKLNETYTAVAMYGDGYKYQGFPVSEDGSAFTFASSYTIAAPLQTAHVHYIIECPQEVETSTDPVYVLLTLADGNTYRYDLR